MDAQKQNVNTRRFKYSRKNGRASSNKQFFSPNSESLSTELSTDSIHHFVTKSNKTTPHKQSSTPYKQSDHYAGPTFHHSPAASNLPIPTFISKLTNTPQSQSNMDSEKVQTCNQLPVPEILSSNSSHTLSNPLYSHITSQTHPTISQNKQTILDSFHDHPTNLDRESSQLSLDMMFQMDTKEKKHVLQKQKTVSSNFDSDFNNAFCSEIHSPSKEGVNRKEVEHNVSSSTFFPDLANKPQKSRDKQNFSKKKKNKHTYDSYIDNYTSEKKDLKNKLLNLLLPPSSKPNNPSTHFLKPKDKFYPKYVKKGYTDQ
ncbi:hypothetical protein PORY_000476 [Pneumocystis oryctolagi]|uniref:Uncharacterized protein n=1 Tax=Pneumocystis oryctolagi TaxID=42067 RepID=A0ACB7CH40_9ASCO|nr:hypothetical protein PORY_000476 [Pneumocystis oryctolagi]